MSIQTQLRERGGSGRRPSSRRGATLVIVAILFTVLIGFAALALDFSRMYSFKAELKTLADAAAMSAVIDQKAGLTESQAEANAFKLIAGNQVEGARSATMTAADIGPVTWDFENRTESGAGSWTAANGVKVAVRYTANWTLAKVFGSATRVINDTTVAAAGYLTTSTCIKPWAFPYASILQKLGKPTPYDVNYSLTAADIATLDNSVTETQFLEKDPPGGNSPGSFGWVDVSGAGKGNPNAAIAASISGCLSGSRGAGSTLEGFPGKHEASDVRNAIAALCGGTQSGNGSNYLMTCPAGAAPILVPIYDTGGGSGSNTTFHMKYIGAFKMTKLDADGLWGYLTSISIPPSGNIGSAPGPVGSTVIVR